MPPQSVGNTGRAERMIEIAGDESGTTGPRISRPTGGGGVWGYYFCEACNHRTENWEGAYRRWVHTVLPEVVDAQPSYGSQIGLSFATADVGAMGRMIWGWMFALDRGLRLEYPAVAEAILSGAACEPPANYKIRLAVTPDLRIFTFTGDRRSDPTLPSAVPNAVVVSPPFVVVLADQAYEGSSLAWLDVSGWLRFAEGELHGGELRLPVVATYDSETLPDGARRIHLVPSPAGQSDDERP